MAVRSNRSEASEVGVAHLQLQFIGAAREVTGSCFLLRVGNRSLLVDCGLIQGTPDDEARNWKPFPFDPRQIDAVILTHAHLDHSGRLPLLVKAGFRGQIYTHFASRDLCEILLHDAAYLNEKESEWENKKRQRRHQVLVMPLYTISDAKAVMASFQALPYDQIDEIIPGIKLRLTDAGHILGSAIAEVWVEDDGVKRKLVFSGDLGHRGAPILRDPSLVSDADLVIMETTYGDRRHRSWDETWSELAGILRNANSRKGNVLIPAFAVGRTQELLYAFNRNFEAWELDRWTIFLDSPMAIEATEVYRKHRNLFDRETKDLERGNAKPLTPPNLHLVRRAEESMHLNRVENGAIIIAGSGMCNGGRIKHHLKHNIWRQGCHLLIVGYQAWGTLGRRLVDGVSEINLWGETISVAAKVHTIGGFSAHADADGLMDWYRNFQGRPPVALVHGEQEAMTAFAARLKGEGAKKVWLPESQEAIDLVKMS